MNSINLHQKLDLIDDLFSPRVIAELNDCHFKLAKIEGDFVWHSHADTDEAFIVVKGRLTMQYRDRTVIVNEGELIVVPKGVEHRPCTTEECHILMVERAGTVNTGDEGGDLTSASDAWI